MFFTDNIPVHLKKTVPSRPQSLGERGVPLCETICTQRHKGTVL